MEKELTFIDLEFVFTIDGRGRPKKAKLFLEFVEKYGIDRVLEEVKKISERKNF
jgi:hypothetical protein